MYDYDENISLYLQHRIQELVAPPVCSLADLLGDDGDYEVYDADTAPTAPRARMRERNPRLKE